MTQITLNTTQELILALLVGELDQEPQEPSHDRHNAHELEERARAHADWANRVSASRLLLGVQLVGAALDAAEAQRPGD